MWDIYTDTQTDTNTDSGVCSVASVLTEQNVDQVVHKSTYIQSASQRPFIFIDIIHLVHQTLDSDSSRCTIKLVMKINPAILFHELQTGNFGISLSQLSLVLFLVQPTELQRLIYSISFVYVPNLHQIIIHIWVTSTRSWKIIGNRLFLFSREEVVWPFFSLICLLSRFLCHIWTGDWVITLEKMIFLIFRCPKDPKSWVKIENGGKG